MQSGIEIEVVWFDLHVVEYRFSCSNGYFSGEAEIFADHNELVTLAENLTKFPSSRQDFRDFELGTFRPDYADGGVRMHFHCRDSVGHAAVDVQLRGDGCKALGEIESVALRIPIEAAAVDSFIVQIKRLEREIGATAHLAMAK